MDELKSILLDVITNKYACIEGRARRKEYWMFTLGISIVFVVLMILGAILGAIVDVLGVIVMGIACLAMLATIVPSICLTVRRLHDINKSGWFYFVSLIPFVGSFILLYFLVTEGTRGDNEFGADPKAEELAA